MNNSKLDHVLLIEDNNDHIEHTVDVLVEGGFASCIHVVKDGVAGINYIFRKEEYSNSQLAPRPSLILLDVRLPKLNGLEVLKMIKSDPDVCVIPVILLTSSIRKVHIEFGADYGVNDYIQKPMDINIFRNKIRALGKYWAHISSLG